MFHTNTIILQSMQLKRIPIIIWIFSGIAFCQRSPSLSSSWNMEIMSLYAVICSLIWRAILCWNPTERDKSAHVLAANSSGDIMESYSFQQNESTYRAPENVMSIFIGTRSSGSKSNAGILHMITKMQVCIYFIKTYLKVWKYSFLFWNQKNKSFCFIIIFYY